MSAPAGNNVPTQALLYASADESGTALAVGSGTASYFTGQATTLDLPLSGIMASFTVSLNPATVTVGQTTGIQVTENAFDAAGEALGTGFVTESLAAPNFTVSATDAAGLSTVGNYSGIGSGPISYSVAATGYTTRTASLQFNAATPSATGYAVVPSGVSAAYVYPPAGTTPIREYALLGNGPQLNAGEPRYDPNGVLWLPFGTSPGAVRVGVNPDGTWAGTVPLPGTLLGFDLNDNVYVVDPASSAVDVYSGSTLVRQIDTPYAPAEATVDPSGDVYVALANSSGPAGLYEYGPAGNGNLTPIATNATAFYAATDGAGNVYSAYYPNPPNGGDYFGVWRAGTFGAGAPQTTYTPTTAYPQDFGVDAAGDVYATPTEESGQNFSIFYAPAGSTSFQVLKLANGLFTKDAEIAVPMK